MLLKLALTMNDLYNRPIALATVVAWHKQVGEWVEYGDEICDLHARAVLSAPERMRVRHARRQLRAERNRPRLIAELSQSEPASADAPFAATPSSTPSDSTEAREGNPQPLFLRKQEFVLRLSALDRGLIRQIALGAGQACSGGELLALISIDGKDAIAASAAQLEQAPLFRTAYNVVPWDEVDGPVTWWDEAATSGPAL
jgi:hypothetical protein